MKSFGFLLFLIAHSTAAEPILYKNKTLTVAVVDTGFGYHDLGHSAPLCKYGHKDFSKDSKLSMAYGTKVPVPMDMNSHGTNVAGLIAKYAGNNNYCLVIIKYYSDNQSGDENYRATVKAFRYAYNLHVDVVNYSGGGDGFKIDEFNAIKKLLDSKTTIVVAAGNEHNDIDSATGAYYPAKYDPRLVVVGNKKISGEKSETSNWGNSVNHWEFGENQVAYGITMTGTSQATAVTTGKMISEGKITVIDRETHE